MMDSPILIALRIAGAACAAYSLWYACLALFRPAAFLRQSDIDRPIVDPGAYTPRWRFRMARNIQIAVVFIGTFVLGYALANVFVWMLPDTQGWQGEDTVSARSAARGTIAFFLAAGFLSASQRIAARLACFPGQARALKNAGDALVRWTSPLTADYRTQFLGAAEHYLETSRSAGERTGVAADKYTAEIEEDFWADVVERLKPR